MSRIDRIVYRIKLLLHFLRHVNSFVCQKSYYIECPRKSKSHIVWDYLKMIVRYGTIDKFYFVYCLDKKDAVSNDYMPYAEFMKLREHMNTIRNESMTSYSYVCLLRDKSLFEWICAKYNIPTPRTIGVLCEGMICLENNQIVKFCDFVRDLPPNTSYFIKDESGICGRGAFSIDKMKLGVYVNNALVSNEELPSCFHTDKKMIVQERVIQHPTMSTIYPHSLNTIRVVSVVHNDSVIILGSLLRLGANGSIVDNWASGGVAVGINNDGTLMQWGFYKPGYGTKIDRHPDTGIVFNGYKLPGWNDVIELVKSCHKKLSVISTVGWDVAIIEKGPIIIEGNDDYDGALLQACTGGKKKVFLKYYS